MWQKNRWRIMIVGAAMLIAALCYTFFPTTHTDAADFNELAATFSNNQLQITIPFNESAPAQSGTLTVELLDAEDKVVATESLHDYTRNNKVWRAKLDLPANLQQEDIFWYRLRYRFQGKAPARDAVIEPISEILRYPVVRLLGQKELVVGANNSLRIVAVDGRNGEPLTKGTLKLALHKPGEAVSSYSTTADVDSHGTAEPELKVPENMLGTAELKISIDTPLGGQQLVEQVNVVERESILLTTDKPIYQPGHLVHIRSLSLDRFTRQASAKQPIVYEIEDAKGNKVFKHRDTTDEFGVASAEFQLADEVNMGNFKLRAILGNANNGQATTQEKTFVVDRYVLPKFKIEVKLKGGEDDRIQKKYYAPGEMVSGRITAKYIFGKPLTKSRISIKMVTFDVETVELGKAEAILDENGQYNFAMPLPTSFAGRSFEQGAAPVALQVEVTDGANHTETKAESLLVSNNPILITAVPESGEMIPKLTNRVYLLTSYPDGTPATTSITGNISPAVLNTDKDGIATLELSGNVNQLNLTATDNLGKSGKATVALKQRANGEDSLMVRTDRALYKVGEHIDISMIATKNRGSIYVDIIKDRQTILTRALDLDQGKAKLSFDLSADLFGTLEVRAYMFGKNADPISDRRIIFVDPADDLQIDAMPVKESFRPGEDAEIAINVRDRFGRPKSAVIDVQVVDEAVFALSEKKPGLEKVFFYLEQELLKPRYEIHSIGDAEIVPVNDVQDVEAQQKRENSAKVLLAAATEVNAYSLKANYGKEKLASKAGDYYEKYYALNNVKLESVVAGLNKYYATKREGKPDLNRDLQEAVKAGLIAQKDITDVWGKKISFTGQMNGNYGYYNSVINWPGNESMPFYFQLYGNIKRTAANTSESREFRGDVNINAEYLTYGEYAQIAGRLSAEQNKSVTNAIIKARNLSTNKVLTARTDRGGAFQFNSVVPGSYEITITAPGYFSTSYSTIQVGARDQAYVAAQLTEGVVIEAVQFQLYGAENSRMGRGDLMRFEGARGGIERKQHIAANAMAEDDAVAAPRLKAVPPAAAMARPMADAREVNKKSLVADKEPETSATKQPAEKDSQAQNGGGEEGPRIRSYFPETLYVNPKLITDKQGRAMVRIPLADSITTWRMTMLASTKQGALGSNTAGIKVFQDFFIDIDLPVSLTQDDVVSIPVAVYNYLNEPHDVELKLQQEDWFELDGDQAIKQVRVGAGEVTGASFRIRAQKIGMGKLTVTARLTDRNSQANGDAIARQIEVIPNGQQFNNAINDRLEGRTSKELNIPDNSINEASKIMVKFYPGPLSQVVEGLDSILRMPGGCFEQTSSSTYPNVLVLDYMKTTKKITPEIQVKAEGFVSLGYQKLVTFEVPGGGFSWFGQAPANKILTAYGLMEFADMSRVYEIDQRVIQRTQDWLARQQQGDGSWQPDQNFIDEGATNNFHNDKVRIAAYIGWALAYSGYKGQAIERAKAYIDKNLNGQEDTYTLAIIANFSVEMKADRNWMDRMMNNMVTKAVEKDKSASWPMKGNTPMYARGNMAEIETTALAAQALIKWGRNAGLATKALQFLTENKDAYGNWQSTQATILSLKAFLLSQQQGSAADTEGTISVTINGQRIKDLVINRDNNDLMHQLDLKAYTQKGRNQIDLSFQGKGSMLYQIVGRYYQPWDQIGREPGKEKDALSIDVKYDRTKLAQDDIATATVTVRNNVNKNVNMVMIDLGIAPGFEVLAEDFQEILNVGDNNKLGKLTKFTITAKQVILYFDGLKPSQVLTLKYRLRAKYPIKARTLASKVYEYYNPQISATAKPIDIVVVDKGKK